MKPTDFKPGADGSDDGTCVFVKDARCNVYRNRAEDCYTKPTGLPIVNDLGNGIAPVTSGEVHKILARLVFFPRARG